MTSEQRKFLEGHAAHLEVMARPETVSSPATRRFQGRLGEAIRAALAEVDRLKAELADLARAVEKEDQTWRVGTCGEWIRADRAMKAKAAAVTEANRKDSQCPA